MVKRKQARMRHLKPRTPDAAVVAQIQKIRPGFSKPCPISFYLYFPSEECAKKSASELQAEQYEVDVVLSTGSSKWLCLATKKMIPETPSLVELRGRMIALAFKYGGEYDGWEAEISEDSAGTT
jgi:hypothetical protein